jgi:hypothetical protein
MHLLAQLVSLFALGKTCALGNNVIATSRFLCACVFDAAEVLDDFLTVLPPFFGSGQASLSL